MKHFLRNRTPVPTTSASAADEGFPESVLFDGTMARAGYPLNSFLASLGTPEHRAEFQEDPETYMDQFSLTPEQRQCVRERSWRGLLKGGANIFFMYKLAALDGITMQDVAASMAGIPADEYKRMMKQGGRSFDV